MNNDKNYKGHMAMLAASIIWGLNSPIGKAALDYGIPPLSLTTFRFFGAAIAFWIVSLFTKKEHVKHEDLLLLFFASLFGIVLNQGTFIFGLSLTSPIDASIVTTMAPIVTMIVAAIVLKEPVTGKKVLGIFVGAIGALLLIITSQSATGGKSGSIWGDMLCLTAQLSFAIYLTVFKDLIQRYSSVTIMKWMFVYASMCFIPFSYSDVASINFSAVPLKVYAEISFVVLAATFLAYLFVMTGQKVLRPTIVSMYNYVQPIVASFVAVSVGMDTFGWPKAAAIILVFVGVFIVTQSKSKAQLDAEVLYQEIDQPEEKIKENDYQIKEQQTMQPFAALDFETANGQRTSVCSVGVIIVDNGEIADQFHSFIRPRPNFYTHWTTQVHGMVFEDTKESPDFPDVWSQIAPKIEGLPLVAHNSPFDEGCLKAVFNLYGLTYPDYQFYCTCRLSRKMHKGLVNHQLHTVSEHCGYDLKQHHHALADAEACAAIAINMLRKTQAESFEELYDFVKQNY